MKRCMYCGHENEDSLVTCAVCGNRLGDPVPTQEVVIVDSSAAAGAQGAAGAAQEGMSSLTDGMPGESGQAAGSAAAAPDMALPSDTAVPGMTAGAEEGMTVRQEGGAGAPGTAAAYGGGLSGIPAGADSVQGAAGMAQKQGEGDSLPSMAGAAGMVVGAVGMQAFAQGQGMATDGAGNVPDPSGVPVGEAPYTGGSNQMQQPADDPMAAQGPAFPGQVPVNSQFGEASPGGQFNSAPHVYPLDRTPGYGEDWRQDVGRGQTYGARTQYEARREDRRAQGAPREGVTGGTYNGNVYGNPQSRDQYGSAGYGYRQPQGQEAQGGRQDYGRRESTGGSKMFMVRARKRVKSVSFVLMALTFTLMLGLNVYNIYCGNALRNITESDTMLANILSGTGTNFFTQMLTELASQLVKMVVNVQDIVKQLGKTVELIIAVVFLVPNVLYCVALWLMFFRTDTKRRQFPMGGYTLARIMMILKFLIACLVLAVGLVISVYFVVVGAQRKSGSIDSSLIQGVILLIVMIVLSVFVVMYYIQWMFCLKVVCDNAKKGTDPGRMPGFLVVISLMCTAICVALMIPMAPNDYVGLASRGAAAAYFLVSGLWVLIYKLRVKRS